MSQTHWLLRMGSQEGPALDTEWTPVAVGPAAQPRGLEEIESHTDHSHAAHERDWSLLSPSPRTHSSQRMFPEHRASEPVPGPPCWGQVAPWDPVCSQQGWAALRTCWGRGLALAHLDVTGQGLQTDQGVGVSKNTDIAMPPRKEQRTQSRALTVLGSTIWPLPLRAQSRA